MAKNLNDLVPQVFLTRQEAADLLRVHTRTLDKWAKDGHLTRYQLGVPGSPQPRPRFLTSEIMSLLHDWEPGEFGRGGLDRNPKGKSNR